MNPVCALDTLSLTELLTAWHRLDAQRRDALRQVSALAMAQWLVECAIQRQTGARAVVPGVWVRPAGRGGAAC